MISSKYDKEESGTEPSPNRAPESVVSLESRGKLPLTALPQANRDFPDHVNSSRWLDGADAWASPGKGGKGPREREAESGGERNSKWLSQWGAGAAQS